MKETCGQCRFFKDKEKAGRDSGCYEEPKPIYRKADDPACRIAVEAWEEEN